MVYCMLARYHHELLSRKQCSNTTDRIFGGFKTPLMTRCVANLIQIMREFCMTAMVSPTGGRRIDLSISDIHFSALLDQELDHSSMAVERRVMEACARVIKARWDSIDLRPLFQ